ncbi:MAG: TauD/TfdA family dioxygenase [Gammaproteobacteria bacterium]|nr:TauD/TfdA family dioxygenase [Gammaproteobacteria bacterium]MCP5199096.1 TauD/TfdA family dioxygenase [Gammaproteobacteria bacterium]
MAEFEHFSLRPRRPGFVAEVAGLDLAVPLAPPVLDALRRAWTAHPVLVVTGQHLDAAALERFAGSFGAFGHDPYVVPLDDHAHVIEVRREARETAPIFGSLWHSDWSFQATPPSATLLYGAEIPPCGGDTVFADGYAALQALSPTLRGVLEGLRGVHSAAPSYGPRGLFARDDDSRSMRIIVSPEAERQQAHPVVRMHPHSGRAALFVNHVYTIGIAGMHADESRALLEFLFKHMTRAEFVYRHRWQPGTLVIWDNRCVVHYADGGYEGHRRLMYRTTLAGEAPRGAIAA